MIPYLGPTLPLGTMHLTNLNMRSVKKRSSKYEQFWPGGSWEDFWMTIPYFYIFVIISPFKNAVPLFEQTYIPFTKGGLY